MKCRISLVSMMMLAVTTSSALAQAPTKLTFAVQPELASYGVAFGSQPVVKVLDASNKVVTWYSGDVTISIKAGTGTAGAILSGTRTIRAIAGVAIFMNLSIDLPGAGYVLMARCGSLTDAESTAFAVTTAASKIAFSVPPAGARAGYEFVTQPVVQVLDASNNVVTKYSGTVTVDITPGTGTPGAVLGGVRTIKAVRGVARFSGLWIDLQGSGYSLTASGAGLAGGQSAPFDVRPAPSVSLTGTPTSGDAGSLIVSGHLGTATSLYTAEIHVRFDPTRATIVDAESTFTPAPGWVTAAYGVVNANEAIWVGYNGSGQAADGPMVTVAVIAQSGLASTYTLTSATNVADQDYTAWYLAAEQSTLYPLHLAYRTQPGNSMPGVPLSPQPVVEVRHPNETVCTTYTAPVTLAIVPGTGTPGATLGPAANLTAACVNGVANYTGLSINTSGLGYQLRATSGDVMPTDSAPVKIGALNGRVLVDSNAPGPIHNGASWDTALLSIQQGINAATDGDEVWVAAGTYPEHIGLKKGVPIYGGFAGTETVRSQRNWKDNIALVSGGMVSIDDIIILADSPNTAIDGLAIRNTVRGICVASEGVTTITNCSITGKGTGVDISGKGSIANCIISRNSTGVNVSDGKAIILNCTITANADCIDVNEGSADITNCIIAFNTKGIYKAEGSTDVLMSHNDVYGSVYANYINIADPTGTNGNISVDPLFADRTNGNLHLLPGSPCIDAGNDSLVTTGATDLDGKPRISGAHVDMGAYEVTAPWSFSLGATVTGGITVAEGVAYVSSNDGRLYACSTDKGSAVPGFPVDISAAVGAPVKLPSRPAVYYGKTGKSVYLTTDRGDVLRILPTGEVAWHVRPVYGRTVSTPAVTPNGEVFVNLSTGEGSYNNYVFKLDEATGIPKTLSPFLGYTTADDMGDYSPAANSRYLYVNAGWSSWSGLTVLNQDNMMVRSSFAAGEQCLSPLLLGSDLILASKRGKVYKMNAVTLNPDMGFGHFGVADIGGQISAAPFADAAGTVYLGTADGRILKRAAGLPNFQAFYTTTGRIAGLTINRAAGVLGFGTSTGSFVQVPLDNPSGAVTVSPGGPISTGTVYEALSDRFIVVTDNGVLCGYPSIR